MGDDDAALETLAWMNLARAPGLDTTRVAAALGITGSARALVSAARNYPTPFLPDVARTFLAATARDMQKTARRWLDGSRHHLVPFTDARFPPLLRATPDCPLALYVYGNPEALREPQLAIVGSRNPTASGCDTAFEFAEFFAARGLGITSGLADGIDACAHRGALRGQGLTLAVLGTGIDRIYPASNAGLSQKIADFGALVSEFSLQTPPRPGNFPRRNRLIAGLTLGTLVVEAARRSGSRITARYAMDYGREVFAIPGSIHNPMSRGCHDLIKSGAILVETGADVLIELNFSAFWAKDSSAGALRSTTVPCAAGMDKDHKILLDALGFDPVDPDTLVARTGFKPEAVSSMMLILELEGHVQAAPGGRYSRVANRRAGGER